MLTVGNLVIGCGRLLLAFVAALVTKCSRSVTWPLAMAGSCRLTQQPSLPPDKLLMFGNLAIGYAGFFTGSRQQPRYEMLTVGNLAISCGRFFRALAAAHVTNCSRSVTWPLAVAGSCGLS